MAEKPDQIERRLRDAPTALKDATLHAHDVQQHIAFSLWRIAEALEENNKHLDRLGMNFLRADGRPGAVENVGIVLTDLVEAVREISGRLDRDDE
jgi:hypothetical protein